MGLSLNCVDKESSSSKNVPNNCRHLVLQKMESQVNAQIVDVDIGIMRFVTSLGIALGGIIDIAD